MAYRFSNCRGCGALIVWIPTPGGKAMPCDPRQLIYWQKKGGSQKIVTRNGEVVSAELDGSREEATGIGYMSHYNGPQESDQG